MREFHLKENIRRFDTIGSTNTFADTLARDTNPAEGTVILADFQESGRGQKENRWISEKGMNLTFSIILYPSFLRADLQFYLSMALSVGILEFLNSQLTGVSVKWPNDIYIGSRKVAGILIENSLVKNRIIRSIMGIGVNINQIHFPNGLSNPTSLCLETGRKSPREEVLGMLLDSIENWLKRLYKGDMTIIKRTYEENLYLKNVPVLFSGKDGMFTGIILGINEYGQLLVRKENQDVATFSFKEIVFPEPGL